MNLLPCHQPSGTFRKVLIVLCFLSSVQEILKGVLGEIFCLIHSSWVNCSMLSDKVMAYVVK